MIGQRIQVIEVRTSGRGFYEVTDRVQDLVRRSGFKMGLATVFLQHTSASLIIQENADPGVRRDLERLWQRLAPDGDPMFEHTLEGRDDMSAHARTALTSVQLSVPILNGALALGTWQGLFVWEHRQHPHSRQLVVHLLGETERLPTTAQTET
jgi:secondary thiamine-phosphate synthase enzyme